MRFFRYVKKIWLQNKVYKYSLKSQDALSKSQSFLTRSNHYDDFRIHAMRSYGTCYAAERYSKLAIRYAIKSEHYKHLSDIYADKKIDFEEKLCKSNFRRVK